MAEKNLRFSVLLDAYSGLLPEKTKEAVEYYYDDDLSLSEIAEIMSMTRQGARSLIKSGEEKLAEYEAALGLFELREKTDEIIEELAEACKENARASELVEKLKNLYRGE